MSAEAPVMIMAGGTGGHIFPALAVAEVLRQRNIPVVWLGSRNSMEERLVPSRGYEFIGLGVKGLRGKGIGTLLAAPFKLVWAVMQAAGAIRRKRPRAVLGLGGFASGPGGLAAVLLRKPLYVQEQNAIPGMTNRTLARFSRCVMEGFPGSFRNLKKPVLHTGNPVRQSVQEIPPPSVRFRDRSGPVRLFVMGGSLGAQRLNEVVPQTLAMLDENQRPVVRHQTGEAHLQRTREAYQQAGIDAEVVAFIDDMAAVYGWADLVIARAGALTIAELAQAGLAAVLVPYPHAVDDHQTVNARVLVEREAAILIPDQTLTPERLRQELTALLADREKLLRMAKAAHALARPDAAERVAKVCLGEIDCLEAAA